VHYLVTGHTGFKGSWLTLLLLGRGHRVSGLALDPAEGSLFKRAGIADLLVSDFRVDIRDAEATGAAVSAAAPDVVVHLAAPVAGPRVLSQSASG
jgi:CDP-glucose 4,6-dehydratase